MLSLLLLGSLLAHAEPARPLDFDTTRSTVWALTRRAGLMSFLGHEHAVLATRWRATVQYSAQDLGDTTADVVIEVPALLIDTAEARKQAGLDVGDGPNAADRAKLQENLLSEKVLDAAKHPSIRFRTRQVAKGEGRDLKVQGELTVHGVTRAVECEIVVESESDGATRFTGKLPLTLSDYGVKPPSVGMFVGVKDEMELRFRFVTKRPTAYALAL
jgi:polyisoprenoid-binding protein YceI